jgi:anti-anti-sigma factor
VRWPDPGLTDTLFYVTTDEDEPCVLYLHGELNLDSAMVLTAVPFDIRRDRPTVLDLTDLTFCDSIGLAALIKVRRRVVEELGHLVLRHPSPPIRQLLRVSGLAPVLPISDDSEGYS